MKKKRNSKTPPVFLVNAIISFTNFLRKLRVKILPPEIVISEFIIEYLVIQRLIFTVTEFWIPNLLEDGPKSIETLAKESGTNAEALYRIMRTLCGNGIFKESEGRIFENTSLSHCLISGDKGTMSALAKYTGSSWAVKDWADLLESVEKGKDIYRIKYGQTYFQWLENHPEEQRIFDEAMVNLSNLSNGPIAVAYKFSHYKSIVDIGGGFGPQLAVILKANPHLKGTLFDIERVVRASQKEATLNNEILKDRVEFVSGDFFAGVPGGKDIYFMKSILHDWSDDDAVKILMSCRKSMHKNSRLLVADMVIKPDNKPHFAKVMDNAMLVLFGGKERTKEEFEVIFEKAGFKLSRIIPTVSPYSLVEGIPV
ncbi:MAG: acetylserotonin O-methyltransferase [Acidobacteria bacterium]|jgi:hypothetical protein|nr:acetylserotonin O-methyltransferase [Acidobacteriota bacterium]